MKKKNLLLFAAALITAAVLNASCSSDSDDDNNGTTGGQTSTVAVQRMNYLAGTWHGELYSSVTNTTACEDLVITAYSSPKSLVGVLTGAITAYGEADVTAYTDDHLLETSKTCYIGFEETVQTGNTYNVSFYQCNADGDVTGSEEKRIFTRVSDNTFKMRSYGLTEENDLTYARQ